MAMTKQFTKTQWNNDREPAITAEQLNRMEKGIDDNDTRIVELDKAVTANKTAGDNSLAEVNKTLQKHTEDITAVNTELTSQGKAIGELADKKITKFYASSQGDTTLSDSDDGKMQDMMLYGKSEQKQYSGKNLLNVTLQATTQDGVTCTNNGDGTYTLNGTTTASSDLIITNHLSVVNGKKYRLIGYPLNNNNGYLYLMNGTDSANDYGAGVTFTYVGDSTDTKVLDLRLRVNKTFNNVIVKPMIVNADKYPNATYDDFEPYTGGIPSPNPDYPQEIKSVVEPVVKVTGKNILKPTLQTTTKNGITCTNNGDGTYTVNGTATANTSFNLTNSRSNITGSGTYKIIGCPFGGSGSSYGLQPNVDGVWLSSKEMEVGNGLVLSPLKSIEDIAIFIRKETTVNNLIFKPMITTYLTATYDDFEPYHEQSVPLTGITLNAIPVSSGGNVTIDGQQYISDYVDVERGKVVRMVDGSKLDTTQSIINKTEWKLATPTEESLSDELAEKLKALQTYYPQTNLFITSNQLDGYAIFNYPISLANGWNYVKQQIGDTRDYIYDMDLQMAQAYVNSEYAVALTELEV